MCLAEVSSGDLVVGHVHVLAMIATVTVRMGHVTRCARISALSGIL